ncbi:prolyl oligopeptidase family serine peptidase [Gloeobacter morelensis]|uniref:prolyl oligopeptidase n=1 Tax=Gloeobacter morelensis MG652769 TaxID=2781736 RepID=A0ABY3PKG7_9CYAN|nr:prolyl oligopeptidase family serine peptidase [Gloeobacter morelensis]UFP94147.1 S9 family peptidase [Gloeobacter morelensis MG652769]
MGSYRLRWPGALLALVLILSGGGGTESVASTPPPATRTEPVSSTYGALKVEDPYRWLEKATSPEVQRWIDAQNAHAEKVLSRYPERETIAERVRALSLTSEQRTKPQLVGNQLFYLRQVPPQEQPVLVSQPWPTGKARVLVDPNRGGGLTAVTEFWPSPSGHYVAYGTADKGTEDTVIRVVDGRTGRMLPEVLRRAGGGTTPSDLVWDADEKGFIYTRFPVDSVAPFNVALFHHRLGTPASRDTLQFGAGLSPYAEYDLLASKDHKYVAALVMAGDGEPQSLYVREADEWLPLLKPREGVIAGTFLGERILVIATGGSPKGRVVVVEGGTFRTLVREGDWAMRDIAPLGESGFLVTEVWGADWRVRQFDKDGRFVRTLSLPASGIGIDAIASDERSSEALVAYSGWTEPGRWVRYDGTAGKSSEMFAVKAAADYSGVKATKIEALSKDGTRVPVTVLARQGTTPDGTAPAILYGYGGYGISVRPTFLGANLAWLERGGVYAVANLRGGGEFGEQWHLDGRLTRKQNVFDDFVAAAEALVQTRWVAPDKLGILGGSNGGLLVGAALTQRPELLRAAVGQVGIYDMLRVELHPNGAFNVTEFGTVDNPDQFAALYAYSPLHRVKDGTAYPAVLLLTGENDPRVDAYQSRKMAARLQAATRSDHPVALITRRAAGHGVGASFSQRTGDRAAALIFFAGELGLP